MVQAVKGIGDSVNGLNNSVQQITTSVSKSVEQNEEKLHKLYNGVMLRWVLRINGKTQNHRAGIGITRCLCI